MQENAIFDLTNNDSVLIEQDAHKPSISKGKTVESFNPDGSILTMVLGETSPFHSVEFLAGSAVCFNGPVEFSVKSAEGTVFKASYVFKEETVVTSVRFLTEDGGNTLTLVDGVNGRIVETLSAFPATGNLVYEI